TVKVSLAPRVEVRKSAVLGQLRQRDTTQEFWANPIEMGVMLDATPRYHDCHRFYFGEAAKDSTGRGDDMQVPFQEAAEGGLALCDMLRSGAKTYGDLKQSLTPGQLQLLAKLQRAGMVLLDGKTVAAHSIRGP